MNRIVTEDEIFVRLFLCTFLKLLMIYHQCPCLCPKICGSLEVNRFEDGHVGLLEAHSTNVFA